MKKQTRIGRWMMFVMLSLILAIGMQTPYQWKVSAKTLEYEDGDVYVGKVNKAGQKNGAGKYYCEDGTVIKGVWKKDYLQGKATVLYPNKEKYVGYFSKDERKGNGTYWFANGDRYKGAWKKDVMYGKGTYTWKNKNYVTGTWKNGKLNGKATLKIGKYKYSIKVVNGKLKTVYSKKRG